MDDLIERKNVLRILRIIGHGRPISGKRAISLISELPSASMWIPCSERLPEPLQNVLVCTDIKTVTVAWINGDGWTFADTGNGHTENWSFENVKFWMPLPEPPINEVTK